MKGRHFGFYSNKTNDKNKNIITEQKGLNHLKIMIFLIILIVMIQKINSNNLAREKHFHIFFDI